MATGGWEVRRLGHEADHTSLSPVPRLTRGAIHPLPHCALMACTGTTIPLPNTFRRWWTCGMAGDYTEAGDGSTMDRPPPRVFSPHLPSSFHLAILFTRMLAMITKRWPCCWWSDGGGGDGGGGGSCHHCSYCCSTSETSTCLSWVPQSVYCTALNQVVDLGLGDYPVLPHFSYPGMCSVISKIENETVQRHVVREERHCSFCSYMLPRTNLCCGYHLCFESCFFTIIGTKWIKQTPAWWLTLSTEPFGSRSNLVLRLTLNTVDRILFSFESVCEAR